jgi:SAM-dependent methyltransferase
MRPGRFTGEFFIPGESSQRIEDDHLERYVYVSRFVSGARVLDVACGSGYGSRLLHDAGAREVVGVDVSEAALDIARSEYASSGVVFEVGDVATYGEDRSFDVIVSLETIEHVPDPAAALRNLRRLLRRDGSFFVSSPNRPITSPAARNFDDRPANPFHVHEFTPRELRAALVHSGFAVDRGVLGQRLQPRLPRFASRVWSKLFQPAERARPTVRRVGPGFSARYFILVAH